MARPARGKAHVMCAPGRKKATAACSHGRDRLTDGLVAAFDFEPSQVWRANCRRAGAQGLVGLAFPVGIAVLNPEHDARHLGAQRVRQHVPDSLPQHPAAVRLRSRDASGTVAQAPRLIASATQIAWRDRLAAPTTARVSGVPPVTTCAGQRAARRRPVAIAARFSRLAGHAHKNWDDGFLAGWQGDSPDSSSAPQKGGSLGS